MARTVNPGDSDTHEESNKENDATSGVVVEELEDVHAALGEAKQPTFGC